MQSTSSHAITIRTTPSTLRAITALILSLLGMQFLIGMLVNLFVKVPSVHPGAQAPEYFSGVVQGVVWALTQGPLWLLLHAIVGLLLFFMSLLLLGFAIAARRRAWIIVSVIGLIGMMGAGFNGASFMNYGHDFSSLLMAIGFLLAAVAYTIGMSFQD